MFEAADYDSVRRPLLQAETLAAHCYTDDAFFAREIERIFKPGWQFVGHVDEIPNLGDTLVVDTVSGSSLVVRSVEGQILAFANACRHRATRLKNDAGNCRKFVCPYHAWSYDLNGDLRAAPGMQAVENFSLADYSLEARRLEIWGGFIFINHQNSSPALLETLGDLPSRMAQYRLDEMQFVRGVQFEVRGNWKLIIENSLEAYHTGIVHKNTVGAQGSESVKSKGEWDALYVFNDPDKSIATLPGEKVSMPFIDGLNSTALSGTYFTVIYPCLQIVFSQDCLWWLDIKPIGVNRSSVTLGSCFPRSTVQLPDFEKRVRPYYQRWDETFEEDKIIAEAQQLGQAADLHKRGRYSAREHCVHSFANWVLDRLLD